MRFHELVDVHRTDASKVQAECSLLARVSSAWMPLVDFALVSLAKLRQCFNAAELEAVHVHDSLRIILGYRVSKFDRVVPALLFLLCRLNFGLAEMPGES